MGSMAFPGTPMIVHVKNPTFPQWQPWNETRLNCHSKVIYSCFPTSPVGAKVRVLFGTLFRGKVQGTLFFSLIDWSTYPPLVAEVSSISWASLRYRHYWIDVNFLAPETPRKKITRERSKDPTVSMFFHTFWWVVCHITRVLNIYIYPGWFAGFQLTISYNILHWGRAIQKNIVFESIIFCGVCSPWSAMSWFWLPQQDTTGGLHLRSRGVIKDFGYASTWRDFMATYSYNTTKTHWQGLFELFKFKLAIEFTESPKASLDSESAGPLGPETSGSPDMPGTNHFGLGKSGNSHFQCHGHFGSIS